MRLDQILSALRSFDGVLELAPEAGSHHAEISCGDYFVYYAPDGTIPTNRPPYATIVTKNHLDDAQSRSEEAERWRLNIDVGSQSFADLAGSPPESIADSAVDFSRTDDVLSHTVVGAATGVCRRASRSESTTTSRAQGAPPRAAGRPSSVVGRGGHRAAADPGQGRRLHDCRSAAIGVAAAFAQPGIHLLREKRRRHRPRHHVDRTSATSLPARDTKRS